MKNLNLKDLKVSSFVTDLKNEEQETAKGGIRSEEYTVCCWVDDPTFFCSAAC